jgi:hypothetical protein
VLRVPEVRHKLFDEIRKPLDQMENVVEQLSYDTVMEKFDYLQ